MQKAAGDGRGGTTRSGRSSRAQSSLRPRWLGLLALALAMSGLAAPQAGATTRPCVLWAEPTSDRENIIWPEITTTYEAGYVPVPPGGYTEIKGLFPHSRFFSLQSSGSNGRNISGWPDYQITPDPGSTNPFVVGADRRAPNRSYTLRVLNAPVPATGPEPNTLYNSSSDGTVRALPGTALVTLRYYLPDRGTGRMAGVPAPTVTMVTPGGLRIPTPTCSDDLGDPGYTETIASTGPQTSVLPGSTEVCGPVAAIVSV